MLYHFRFILPLLNGEDEEYTPLHYYDSAIQLARNAAQEPTEDEFVMGMQAAEEIMKRCARQLLLLLIFLHLTPYLLSLTYLLEEDADGSRES
jgi:hypothetical protein